MRCLTFPGGRVKVFCYDIEFGDRTIWTQDSAIHVWGFNIKPKMCYFLKTNDFFLFYILSTFSISFHLTFFDLCSTFYSSSVVLLSMYIICFLYLVTDFKWFKLKSKCSLIILLWIFIYSMLKNSRFAS